MVEAELFTKTKFIRFVKLYKRAVKNKRDCFMFEEQSMLTSYAKYLIEYLEPKFKGL